MYSHHYNLTWLDDNKRGASGQVAEVAPENYCEYFLLELHSLAYAACLYSSLGEEGGYQSRFPGFVSNPSCDSCHYCEKHHRPILMHVSLSNRCCYVAFLELKDRTLHQLWQTTTLFSLNLAVVNHLIDSTTCDASPPAYIHFYSFDMSATCQRSVSKRLFVLIPPVFNLRRLARRTNLTMAEPRNVILEAITAFSTVHISNKSGFI